MKNTVAVLAAIWLISNVANAGMPTSLKASARYGVALLPYCAIFHGKPVAAGTPITLIFTDSQKRFRMTIGHAVSHCGGDRRGEPGYQLLGDAAMGEEELGLAVAVIGTASKNLAAHECTSSEGVHVFLSARQGGRSLPFWHQYYWAGYDTEPNCTDKDIRQIDRLEPAMHAR